MNDHINFEGGYMSNENNDLRYKELRKLYKHLKTLESQYEEVWRPILINDEVTDYLCSSYGRIKSNKSDKGFILTPVRMPNGYYVCTLYHNLKSYREYYHRIVAMTFISVPDKYIRLGLSFKDLEVNHLNGNEKWNNTIYNLEWVTDSDNKYHAYNESLKKSGEESHFAEHTEEEVENVCKLIESNEYSIKKIAEMTNNEEGFVYDIYYKGSWTKISDKYDFSKYTPKQKKYTDEQLELMRNMLSSGDYTFKEISEATGIKIKTVYYYNKKI